MNNWVLKNIFLLFFIGIIFSTTIYFYQRPSKVKKRKEELTKSHEHFKNLIKKAIDKSKQQQGGTRVYGAGPVAQELAEMNELDLMRQLDQEQNQYNDEISKLKLFNLSYFEIVSLIGILATLLALHLQQRQ